MKRRRVALVGLFHETNTFSAIPATYDTFNTSRGATLLESAAGTQSVVAGYLAGIETDPEAELVPLMRASTGPIGIITADAYSRLTGEMFGLLREQGPWDGVLIANHGAAASEEHADADGFFCASVRGIVGESCVVGVCLDMHANLSALVVDSTDVCVVWRTTPHLDTFDRGQKTAELVLAATRGEIRPVQWVETPPLIMNITQHFTASEPMLSLCNDAVSANERPGILDTSVAQGYPYGDVPQLGMAWVAIADGDLGAARSAAQWMSARAWERRESLCSPPGLSPADAVREADRLYFGPQPAGPNNSKLFKPRGPDHGMNFVPENGSSLSAESNGDEGEQGARRLGPVVIMDIGDNIGGGSTADSTFLLQEAVEQGVEGFLLTLKDPAAVDACVSAGVGAKLSLEVGAKTDGLHGSPVRVTAVVKGLSDGRWEDNSPTHGGGRFFSAGRCALVVAAGGNVTVLLTEKQSGNTSRGQFYQVVVTGRTVITFAGPPS